MFPCFVDRSPEGQPFTSHDAFPTTSSVPTRVSPVPTTQHAAQEGEKPGHGAHLSPDIHQSYNSICLISQQRVPAGQAALKEEKLPPQPVMRGESFNPAMRPDHHKHPDVKPSQPGHSQQSEDHFPLTFNLEGGAQDIKAVCVFVEQV